MLAERWRQIDEIFIAALNLSPDRRASFLTAACGSDEELRREVESLLAAHEQAGDFINAPALETVARGVAQEAVNTAAAVPAAVISSYEILSLLGTGGMSEVYLARDARLGRPVALKLLSPQFLQDAERVRRFEREGRAASALNHPNILTIYEAGQTGETYFIATEYVEGKTLRQLITPGGLKIQEALNIVIQIAEALESAHRAGIVHRDIKPENIMIRPDGYVKVLDFGLAKLAENFKALIGNQEFTFGSELTSPGIIMGTLTYMSPEQASGREVDRRTDIWSLGVLIYELVTGSPPFKGYDAQCTLEAILNQEPARISIVGSGEQSRELERIIGRTLEKDRELRFQTVSDLRSELKRFQRDLELSRAASEAEHAPPSKLQKKSLPSAFDPRNLMSWKALFGISAAIILAAAVSLYILQQFKTENNNLPFKYASVNRLTEQAGAESYPSLSADGRAFVYASRATGKWKIYWQRAGGKMPLNLTQNSDSDDTQPAFSPDNKQIAFRSSRDGGGIFIMGATGESVRRVTDFGYNPAWSPDGKKIVFATDNIVDAASRPQIPSQIWIVDIESGEKRQLATADGVQPSWSPGGHRIAYWGVKNGGERDIWTLAVDGGEPLPVTVDASTDWNPIWSPDGKYLYFISDRTGSMNVWRISIDEQSGKILGQPEPVTTPSTYSAFLSFSKNGKLAYVQVNDQANLQQVEFDPVGEVTVGQSSYITQGSNRFVRPSISPAGDWLVYYRRDFQEDIFISKPDGTDSRQLTNDEHRDRMPRLSPDGSQIVFFSDRSGRYENWIINRDGSELRQLTKTSGRGLSYATWSPDGSRLACAIQGGNSFIIETGKRWAEQTPQYLPQMDKPGESMAARSWSPDGRKLAGGRVRDGRGGFGIAVYSFDSQKYESLLDYGNDPVWLSDSRRLLFAFQGKIYLIDSKTGRLREILSVAPNGINGFDITRENRNIYFSLTVSESDIWLLDLMNSKFSPNKNK